MNKNGSAVAESGLRGGFILKLNSILYRFSYLIAVLIVFCIFAVLFNRNNIWPFGNLTVSWCDGDQQFIPLLCDFKDILEGKQGFFLSTANSGGMNFYGVFFFNLSSPFTFLVAFFPKSQMAYAFNLMVMAKLIVSTVTMSFLLRRKTDNFALVVFPSVLYAFSGYAMMYYQIAQWLDVYYMFPLVLLGLERITEGKSCLLYVISLFLCVLFQFYLAYPVILFVCIYASVYVIFNRGRAGGFVVSFLLGSVIAALMSAVVLIPCFLQYTQSMRTSGIIDSLTNSNFFPATNTSLPTFFCLAPLIAFAVYAVIVERRNFLVPVFLLTLFPVFIEPIAKAWQTFNYMAFPTRYGFIPITLCLYMFVEIAQNMSSPKEDDMKDIGAIAKLKSLFGEKAIKIACAVILCAVAVLIFGYSITYYSENGEALSQFAQTLWGNVTSYKGLLLFALFSALAGTLCFVALKYELTFKSAVFGAIALCLVCESVFSCNVYMVSSVTFRSPQSNMANKIKYISELEDLIDDDDYYRVKVKNKSFEVNMVGAMGYNSLSHYTSLNGKEYMMTAKALGYSSYWMEVNSCGGTIFSDALVRNKYTIRSGNYGKKYKTPGGKYSIDENTLLFPAAFVVPQGEYFSDYDLERWEIQEKLYQNLTGETGLFTKYQPASLNEVEDLSSDGLFVYKRTSLEDNSVLKYKIKIEGKQHLYFDLFDQYSNALREHTYENILSVKVQKRGMLAKQSGQYPVQNSNGILDLGEYSDCDIVVTVNLAKDISAKSFGVFSIDVEKLESAVNRLISGDFKQINNGFTAKIDSPEGNFMFVAMPYDAGYTAIVNGTKREVKPFGGFMSIPLDRGENQVEVKFVPRGFGFGLAVTAIGVVAFAFYIIDIKRGKFIERIAGNKKIGKIGECAVFALGVAVLAVIYLFPVIVNLASFF